MNTFLVGGIALVAGYVLGKFLHGRIAQPPGIDQQEQERIKKLEQQIKVLLSELAEERKQDKAPLVLQKPLPNNENSSQKHKDLELKYKDLELKYKDLELKYREEQSARQEIEMMSRTDSEISNAQILALEEQLSATESIIKHLKKSISIEQQQDGRISQQHRKEMNQLCAMSKRDAIEFYQKQVDNMLEDNQRLESEIAKKNQLLELKKKQAKSAEVPSLAKEITHIEKEIQLLRDMQGTFQQQREIRAEYLKNLRLSVEQP